MHDAYEIIKNKILAKHNKETMKIEDFISDGKRIHMYCMYSIRCVRSSEFKHKKSISIKYALYQKQIHGELAIFMYSQCQECHYHISYSTLLKCNSFSFFFSRCFWMHYKILYVQNSIGRVLKIEIVLSSEEYQKITYSHANRTSAATAAAYKDTNNVYCDANSKFIKA